MKHANLITSIWRSFYSRKLYTEAGQTWRGYGFVYLLVLLAICWVFISGRMYVNYGNAFQKYSPVLTQISKQIPTMKIKSGIIVTKIKKPVFVKSNEGEKIGVIDVSNQYGVDKFTQSKYIVLLQKNQILFRQGNNDIKSFKLTALQDGIFGPQQFQTMATN